jgi:hypothetical protein
MAKVIEIADSHEEAAKADKAFWATQTPQARLRHTFELRRLNYGTNRISNRLQRVLEITQRPSR